MFYLSSLVGMCRRQRKMSLLVGYFRVLPQVVFNLCVVVVTGLLLPLLLLCLAELVALLLQSAPLDLHLIHLLRQLQLRLAQVLNVIRIILLDQVRK